MGRSAAPPYIYDPPARYSVVSTENKDFVKEFDPKAVSRASWQTTPKKKKPAGPLVNQINRHPDSYIQAPYGNLNKKPMSLKVKDWIKWTRLLQLLLRVLQFLGAVGLLVCVITIRGTEISEGWIIRVPAGVDIIVTLYAIYHLSRAAKKRTPASSASYHFFALILDAGLIPFYIFTALMSHMHHDEKLHTKGRWRTVFKTPQDTNTILVATWLIAVTTGAMHIASLFIDLYLVIIFRKISNLPPDMSPLDDARNSRRKNKKHKHKNSSITVTTETTLASEKRFSAQSGMTNGSYASIPNPALSPRKGRDSQNEPLLPHQKPGPRPTSFYDTRNDSSVAFSPHTPETARLSRADLPSQMRQSSARNSAVDLQRQGRRSRANTRNGSRPTSMVADSPHVYTAYDDGLSQSQSPQRSPKRRSRHEQQLHDDNWFVVAGDSDAETGDLAEPYARPGGSAVSAVSSHRPTSSVASGAMQPLGMHPPSPVPTSNPGTQKLRSTPTRTATTQSHSTMQPGYYSPSRSGTRGRRYYGELKAAAQGVRATPPPSPSTWVDPVPDTGSNWIVHARQESPRVVSRTGVDVDASADLGLLSGDMRGRDVSGKVAEEGRGGPDAWYPGGGQLVQRRVSGMA